MITLERCNKNESRYTPLNLHSSSAVSPHYLPLWPERRTNPLTLWTWSQRSTNSWTLIQQSSLPLLPHTTVGTAWRLNKHVFSEGPGQTLWYGLSCRRSLGKHRVVIWLLHLSQKLGVNSLSVRPLVSAWNESGVWRDWAGCEGNQKEMLQEYCVPVWTRKEADPHGFIMWGWNKTFHP